MDKPKQVPDSEQGALAQGCCSEEQTQNRYREEDHFQNGESILHWNKRAQTDTALTSFLLTERVNSFRCTHHQVLSVEGVWFPKRFGFLTKSWKVIGWIVGRILLYRNCCSIHPACKDLSSWLRWAHSNPTAGVGEWGWGCQGRWNLESAPVVWQPPFQYLARGQINSRPPVHEGK